MAKIDSKPLVQLEIVLRLTEDEAAALDALAGYGTEAFLKVFYTHLGTAYLQPHEKGLRSLFNEIRCGNPAISTVLDHAKQARKDLQENNH
jgi:hypothetical protein